MKERPILFSAPMVRAILDGQKTQTRRLVTPQPKNPRPICDEHIWADTVDPVTRYFSCKIGLPGDRLWVRETWVPLGNVDPITGAKIECTAGERAFPDRDLVVAYRANSTIEFCDHDGFSGEFADKDDIPKWKPSIFMPRWASRITLEITSVRLESLHEISRGDAMQEGCPFPNMANGADPRRWYEGLWDVINGLGSWAKNPWVWVIEFRRIEP